MAQHWTNKDYDELHNMSDQELVQMWDDTHDPMYLTLLTDTRWRRYMAIQEVQTDSLITHIKETRERIRDLSLMVTISIVIGIVTLLVLIVGLHSLIP